MDIHPTSRQATIEKLYGHLSTALDKKDYDNVEQLARCLNLLETKRTSSAGSTTHQNLT